MASKNLICALLATTVFTCCLGGFVPAVPAAIPAAYSIVPYASSYNAHVINHAVAAPLAAAPAARLVSAHLHTPLAYRAAGYASPFVYGK